jgi:2-polyprenyl-3-methyl-5-hydroxy-6-metoxy-1,4-benzoquinol methylase
MNNLEKPMNEHKCPVCGVSQSSLPICEANGFSVYGCNSCGADHVFPMPKSDVLKAYYDREEWFEGNEVGGYKNYDQQTAWSVDAVKPILEEFVGVPNPSVLDVGCGYGTHLEFAAARGWKCFGIEVSDHARQVAQERLKGNGHIVEAVDDLIPHEFDLILMLDVIEHLPSPYTVFYSLFSIGAITPKTRIVISTPNAGSTDARKNPAEWTYRHPPSHLVYYTAESLRFLLEKLHFSNVQVQGVHPTTQAQQLNAEIANYAGLLVTAQGSDFTEFMRERYVPGTWSKIAAYEHLPRYELAKVQAIGKNVLDFGCGTGYGSAALAEVAASVTGLDIDQAAITWANATHRNSKLTFHLCSDLGATLPKNSFDIVTCFEMIEHVNYETQQAAIASIAQMLRKDGTLLISTPNPEITKLYGANPYHLREMTLPEFHDLLGKHFSHVRVLTQRVRNSISFSDTAAHEVVNSYSVEEEASSVVPLAFVAICTNQTLADIDPLVVFDEDTDLIHDYLQSVKKLNQVRFKAYSQEEQLSELARQNERLLHQLETQNQLVSRLTGTKWHRLGQRIKLC